MNLTRKLFKLLEANVQLNDFNNITLINSAVGNKKDDLYFTDEKADDANKIVLNSKDGVKVKVNTLNDLLKHIEYIDVLKIDVEGYEKPAFEGAHHVLDKTKLVYLESFEKNFLEYNYSTGDLIQLLNQQSFLVYKIINNKQLLLLNESYKSIKCENLVATKDATCLEVDYNFEILKN